MRSAPLAVLSALVLAGCADPGPGGPVPSGPEPALVRAGAAACGACFLPAEVLVAAGQPVRWEVEQGHHTIAFEDANATSQRDSGDLAPGALYMLRFEAPGTWRYRCIYHSADFAAGMVGQVEVA